MTENDMGTQERDKGMQETFVKNYGARERGVIPEDVKRAQAQNIRLINRALKPKTLKGGAKGLMLVDGKGVDAFHYLTQISDRETWHVRGDVWQCLVDGPQRRAYLYNCVLVLATAYAEVDGVIYKMKIQPDGALIALPKGEQSNG